MGIAERKEREKQEMRRKILDAAFEMFVEVEYERTSIRAIAEKIPSTAPPPSTSIKDKDELLYDVQREAFDLLAKSFAPLAEIRHPFERLRALGLTYLDFAFSNPQYYGLMFILTARMNVVKENMLWENGCDAYEFLLTTVPTASKKSASATPTPTSAHYEPGSMVHGLASVYLKKPLHGHGHHPNKPPKACASVSANTSTTSAPDIFYPALNSVHRIVSVNKW